MYETLDESYLTWLYNQVVLPRERKQYWKLFRILFKTEYVWLIPNDDNRAEDGRALRHEFLDHRGIDDVERDWLEIGCSFLEMLVALSNRLSFEAEQTRDIWFWVMMDNLNLSRLSDRVRVDVEEVTTVLNAVVWRTYDRNGRGGLFPLSNPDRDQRQVELWYQLNAYLLEHDYI